MRINVQKGTEYPKHMSYAQLAQGASTGVWGAEDWSASAKKDKSGLARSLQEAAKRSKR